MDHYLEILLRKPGAMPGSSALAQARARGVFTELHQRFWDVTRAAKGDADGTRLLWEVLLLARRMPAAQLTAGIAAALQVGSTDPAVIAVEARRHAGGGEVLALPVPVAADEQVGAAFDRPAPTLADYDTLLEPPARRRRRGPAHL